MRVASVDLGSNTFELLIADKYGDNLNPLLRKLEITRLGGDFDPENRKLSEKSVLRSIDVISDYANIIKKKNVDITRAVATSVVRNSSNSGDFLRRIYEATGLKVDIISGLEESRLSSLGVIKSSDIKTGYCLVVDIGGGSTELSIIENGNYYSSFSADIGVVSISENIIKGDIPELKSLEKASEFISGAISTYINEILNVLNFEELCVVFNAGTPLTIACSLKGLKNYSPEKVDGSTIYVKEVYDFYNKIVSINSKERSKLFPSIKKGREDLIVPGTIIVMEILNSLKVDNFIVSQAGILEGLIYQIQ